jgi:hypothetical protein
MYGGGFATIPAYLADIFGTRYVGAIHGRLLTAWSTAGVLGPFVIGQIRDTQIAAGVDRALVYDRTMYILASFLVVGFICNALVRPVADKWLMQEEPLAKGEAAAAVATAARATAIGGGGFGGQAAIVWTLIALPILWGVSKALESAVKLFQ